MVLRTRTCDSSDLARNPRTGFLRKGFPMKLLVIGSGMMGSAAAFDMARTTQVDSVTLADSDLKRVREVAARGNRITGGRKVRAVVLDAGNEKAAAKLMRGHDAALSAVPYFLNLGLARAAVDARCHFADLGGNNTVVRQELALSKRAESHGVALAPDCGLSPGMASILGANWSVGWEAAPTRCGCMSAVCRSGPRRRFIISSYSPLKAASTRTWNRPASCARAS